MCHQPVKFGGHRYCGGAFSLSRDAARPRD